MSQIPRTRTFDSTLAMLSEGYLFVSRRARRYDSDVFRSRVMLREAVFAVGQEAAAEFYEPGRMTRKHALPITALKLLQDTGSVQVLDGEAHASRKRMFMSMMTSTAIDALSDAMADEWGAAVGRWASVREVVLFDQVQQVLCRAVCRWAAVPLPESQVTQRTREFAAMVDGAGAVGPRNWRGMLLRTRTERWARTVVGLIRSGELRVPEGTAAHFIAWHRGSDGDLLDADVAAVELINVLRPTVAVAYFITFAALALHQYPEWATKLRTDDDIDNFVHEVRRFYPMFPMVGGRVIREFDWRGHHFAKGSWMLLDVYGTNHDPRIWDGPQAFRPDRFRQWDGSPYNFIPQGGGDFDLGHRCAGEWITIALVRTAVRMLLTSMRYDVPAQDLQIDLTRMPTIPRSRFQITNVRPAAESVTD